MRLETSKSHEQMDRKLLRGSDEGDGELWLKRPLRRKMRYAAVVVVVAAAADKDGSSAGEMEAVADSGADERMHKCSKIDDNWRWLIGLQQ